MSFRSWIDRFRGHRIWIIGSSAAIDDLPDDFLDGRLTIGLNESYLRWRGVQPERLLPRAPTWVHVCEQAVLNWIRRQQHGASEVRIVATDPLYPKGQAQGLRVPALSFQSGGYRNSEDPECDVRAALQLDYCRHRYRSHGTCLHTAVMIAILLGSRHITTVGCGDAEGYCEAVARMKHETQQIPAHRRAEQRAKQQWGTDLLRRACESYGITLEAHQP